VARARKALAIFLYRFATYQLELNTDVLEMVKTELPALTAPLGAAKLDNQAEAQQHPNGSFKFQYGMYVDDGLSAIPANEPNGVHRMVASSCKAAYLLLGYPGPIQNPTMPPTMSWDKMQDRPVNPFRDSLGLAIDGDRMEVTIPAKQLDRLFDILMRHWTPKRKHFMARAAAQLIGNLLSCIQGCHWLQLSITHLQQALRDALRNNWSHLIHTQHFKALLMEQDQAWLEPDAGTRVWKLLGIRTNLARALWHCKETTWTPKAVHDECEWLCVIIAQHKTDHQTWTRPISHIVRRAPDFVGYQDACTLWGMGGHSPDLQYYWRMSWHDLHADLPDKIKHTLNKKGSEHIHINWLEFAAIMVNYAAVIVTARHNTLVPPFPPI
jgi:hypothetical protein